MFTQIIRISGNAEGKWNYQMSGILTVTIGVHMHAATMVNILMLA